MSTAGGTPDDSTRSIGPDAEHRAASARSFGNSYVAPGARSGDMAGPYKLLEVIGEGGFGEVWLAERREPMLQRVAVKIIKPGMDSRAVVARFEQERQALAMMDHPNVARVLDGGVTAAGQPYFAMEFVKGESITRFADRERLTIRERLELFVTVCDAVQHAHMKGIIHRDIKPSNILVAPAGEGHAHVVKVIDFGVAKAISQTLTDKTLFTERGQIIGTPEYMSPEQAEMGANDIDTRTDVYSLGVVLYELLSGTLPFDPKTLRSAGYAEIQRIIREVDPPKPSIRLGAADNATGAEIAKARQTERERITGELRRELEWIPMKALRKDRTRRYASAESLGADVRRYLDGKPLEAAPESRAYLVRKFVRRNRVQVLAASAVAVALVAGLAGTAWQARAAAAQARRADERAVAAEAAEKAEKQRAEELKRVSDFQSQMLSSIDTTKAGVELMDDVRARFAKAVEKAGLPEPERAAQAETLASLLERVNATDIAVDMIDRTIIRPAIGTIDERFKNDPKTDASLRQALADLYWVLGLNELSFPLQESALEKRRKALGEDHPDTLLSLNHMGVLLKDEGRLREAEPYLRSAVEKRTRVLGADDPETGKSINSLAHLLDEMGRLEEAEPLYRESIRIARKVYGDDDEDTIGSTSNLATLLSSTGRLEEAEAMTADTLARSRRALGDDFPTTIILAANLSGILVDQGKYAEAEPYLREAHERFRRTLGEDHPRTLVVLANLGRLLHRLKKSDEAARLIEDAIANMRRVLGEDHPTTAKTIGNLARVRMSQGKFAEAEPLMLEAFESLSRVLGDKDLSVLGAMNNIVDLYTAWDKAEASKGYLAKAAEWKARLDAAAKAARAVKVE